MTPSYVLEVAARHQDEVALFYFPAEVRPRQHFACVPWNSERADRIVDNPKYGGHRSLVGIYTQDCEPEVILADMINACLREPLDKAGGLAMSHGMAAVLESFRSALSEIKL